MLKKTANLLLIIVLLTMSGTTALAVDSEPPSISSPGTGTLVEEPEPTQPSQPSQPNGSGTVIQPVQPSQPSQPIQPVQTVQPPAPQAVTTSAPGTTVTPAKIIQTGPDALLLYMVLASIIVGGTYLSWKKKR